MKVLFISANYPPDIGGAATYFGVILPELAKFNEIEKLILIAEFRLGKKIIEHHLKISILRLLIPRFTTRVYSLAAWRPMLGVLFYIHLFLLLPIISLIYRPIIFHIHCAFAKRQLIQLGKWLGMKVVTDQKDLFIQSDYKKADAVIASTKRIEKELFGFGVNKDKVYPIAIPQPDVSRIIKKGDPPLRYLYNKTALLFVGNLHPLKGVSELIEAFSLLKNNKEFTLILVGKNLMGKDFLQQIDRTKNIKYLGEQMHQNVIEIINQVDLVILPSKSEGLPHVCMEAILLGKKVLLPPNIEEFQQHCPEYIINEITPGCIAKKINWVLKNDQLPSYPLENHKPSLVAMKTFQLYQKLI